MGFPRFCVDAAIHWVVLQDHVDKHASYPPAFEYMQEAWYFKNTDLRRVKYLNNLIEQDHRHVKRKYRQAMGYHSLETARNTLAGIESMHMIFKGQTEPLKDVNAYDIKKFIKDLFEVENLAA